MDEDTFVIVEISTLSEPLLKSRNSEFRMTEIMVAQRFSKMSGKCIITLLNRITTNFLPTFQLVNSLFFVEVNHHVIGQIEKDQSAKFERYS